MEKNYAASINKQRKILRVHLMSCNSRKVHENRSGNQKHFENLTLNEAKKILKESNYIDKQFCGLCMKEYN